MISFSLVVQKKHAKLLTFIKWEIPVMSRQWSTLSYMRGHSAANLPNSIYFPAKHFPVGQDTETATQRNFRIL